MTKFLVYNARKRQPGGDQAATYFERTECVAGVQDEDLEVPVREMLAWVGLEDRASARPASWATASASAEPASGSSSRRAPGLGSFWMASRERRASKERDIVSSFASIAAGGRSGALVSLGPRGATR